MGIDNATDIATGAYYIQLVLKEDGTKYGALDTMEMVN